VSDKRLNPTASAFVCKACWRQTDPKVKTLSDVITDATVTLTHASR